LGLLEPQYTASHHGGWSAEIFDQADFALFTALTYPHASAKELELLTGWHSVIWCLDDVFLPWCEALGNREQILRRIERLMTFLPLTAHVSGPAPEQPLERALADLWHRTAPSASYSWRLLYTRAVREFLEASLWEADNLTRRRFPDLIEQTEMRRDYGAAGCSALLMEHSLGWEIAEEIRETRPFTVLINAFRDTVDLHNDIVSYPKEVREGVAKNNIVQVTQELHDLPLHAAVSLVDRILTGRVRTLDETVRTDLPQALRDLRKDQATQHAVLRHARAIQGWAAGSYRWHQSTERYRCAV
jgi:germacradienol/geosmin synthase